MKILMVIFDGLGDRPIKELGNKTPLESAKTPNLDYMAKNGFLWLVKPVFLNNFPTSKDTHLSLFGYNLKKWSMGRGVFEVLGAGSKLKKGDLALRGNLAAVDDNLKIIDRRAGRVSNVEPLIKSLTGIEIKGIKFFLISSVSHRLGLVLRGRNLSEDITDGDFHKVGIIAPKISPLKKTKNAEFTAGVLNEFLVKSHKILKNHSFNKKRAKKNLLPANYILVREAGKFKKIPGFFEKWKMKAACVAGGGLYKGLAKVLKMDLIKVQGATGRANTNLSAKFKAARQALKKYDFVYCHIKAVDNFSHDGDFQGKKKFLEKIDKELSILLEMKNILIIVTGDHSTPCKVQEHTSDFIPALVFNKKQIGFLSAKNKDFIQGFSEKSCKKQGEGIIKQNELIKKTLALYKGLTL